MAGWPSKGDHSKGRKGALSPLGGGWRLRSSGRLTQGCCRSTAAETAPAAPPAGDRDSGAPSWQERREWRVNEAGAPRGELVSVPGLLEAEVVQSLPPACLAWRRHLRPLLAGTCLWRSLPAKLPIPLPPGSALPPCHQPFLLPVPSSLPQASYFLCAGLFIHILVSPSEVDWRLLFPFSSF